MLAQWRELWHSQRRVSQWFGHSKDNKGREKKKRGRSSTCLRWSFFGQGRSRRTHRGMVDAMDLAVTTVNFGKT